MKSQESMPAHDLEYQANQLWAVYGKKDEKQFWAAYGDLLKSSLQGKGLQKIASYNASVPAFSPLIHPSSVDNAHQSAAPPTKKKSIPAQRLVPFIILLIFLGWLAYGVLSSENTTTGSKHYVETIRLAPYEVSQLAIKLEKHQSCHTLFIEHSRLSSLPASLGNLSQLEEIYLSSNRLTSLPKEIGQLTKLRKLYLAGNRLQTLPKEIGQLTNLQGLYLGNNWLYSLPEEIKNLKKLKALYLYDNPISDIEKAKIKRWLPNCEVLF